MLREITHALRGLVRNPAYSATAVLTLTLAVGATAAIFSVVGGALLKALPYEDAHRLVFLSESEPQVPEMSVASIRSPSGRRGSSRPSQTVTFFA